MGTISINQAIIIGIITLAPLIGHITGKLTIEELKQGKKYFIILQHALFLAIATVFLYAHKTALLPAAIGLTTVFAYLEFDKFKNQLLIAALQAIAFALTSQTTHSFLLNTTLFLHGLPTGTLSALQKNGLRTTIVHGATFCLTSTVLIYLL